jgi:hypothetical protein
MRDFLDHAAFGGLNEGDELFDFDTFGELGTHAVDGLSGI